MKTVVVNSEMRFRVVRSDGQDVIVVAKFHTERFADTTAPDWGSLQSGDELLVRFRLKPDYGPNAPFGKAMYREHSYWLTPEDIDGIRAEEFSSLAHHVKADISSWLGEGVKIEGPLKK